MGARAWGRLSVAVVAVGGLAEVGLSVLWFATGHPVAGWICAAFAVVFGVRLPFKYRWYRRSMREHEARLAEIRAEARRRVEEIEARVAQQRREAVLRLVEELRRNAPHN